MAHNRGDLVHQLAELFPFVRAEIRLNLRVNTPFGIHELSFARDMDVQQFDIPDILSF